MRFIVKSCFLIALLWSLYWLAAAYGVRSGIAGWFAHQSETGWQADYADLDFRGFPLRFETQLVQPALADPATGVAWQADALTLASPAWWPGDLTLTFPDTPQHLSYLDQTVVLTAQAAQAELKLAPGPRLELQNLSLLSGPWTLQQEQGSLLGASGLRVSATQLEYPLQYHFIVSADQFRPGDITRAAMHLPDSWPVVFDALELDATVTFDRPWDRDALETARPQPRQITLKLIEIKWGDLQLFATGQVTVDASGVPTGAITIKADNWRDMLALAEQSGTLAPGVRRTTENVLGMLAGLSGNANALDIELDLRDGIIALGPIQIGEAPRFILR